jgi:hypothetical protein
MPVIRLPEGFSSDDISDDGVLEVESTDIEYADDESPEGFISTGEMNGIIQSRLSRERRSLRSTLKEDEDFFKEAAKERGYDFRDDGRLKGSTTSDAEKKLRQTQAELEAKNEKLETLTSKLSTFESATVENDILRHASGVKDSLKDAFVREVKSKLSFDEEEGRPVQMEDGEIKYVIEDGKSVPASTKHVISQLQESQPDWFASRGAISGPASQPTREGSGGKVYSEDEYKRLASKTHTMSDEDFEDWQRAPEEGRVK